MKTYTKPSRWNPTLTLDQYKVLLERKKEAQESNGYVRYKDLVEQWGIKPYYMATAVFRGIKQYDYILWKQGQLQ